ncbi:hypothetical protein PAXRUDRAFT_29754 [Paxillus rubicundulus Ve08.2h10]|uniref:CASTOR ACT domain-containing protein n=1 Tax=Paxillus rubicundulus Ve08.2h10 TaxID=930991 RepID=A0A0D0DNK8_9AGAM|nr:hypothetical protein PAXRUDRAFT_29754 [Paxillus rubicundulus Ve08.2h10]
MAVNGPSNVTITLLPVTLSLVHIPRSRLPQLSHAVLRQILQPNPTFLNVTCNEIELSLFAEHRILEDFEAIARRDRQRQRSRSGSGSSRKRTMPSDADRVEISYEKWNVLQIDSHSDQLADNSGARVHELSAPLAAAGISILYQSSYMSDFIFVKETRLQEVMVQFRAAGFDLYSSNPEMLMSRIASPLLSPILMHELQVSDLVGPEFSPESGAVWTRTRKSVDASVSAAALALHNLSSNGGEENEEKRPQVHRPPSRNKSHSPSSNEVTILTSKLACVGLSDESMDSWALKVVKLVAFPDLIPVKSDFWHNVDYASPDGVTKTPSRVEVEAISIPSFLPRSRKASFSTDSISSCSEEDEGYFSHSPCRNHSTTSLTSLAGSRSYPDISQAIPSSTPSFKPTAKYVITQVPPLSPVGSKPGCLRRSTIHSENLAPADKQMNGTQPKVPFFSFTRTSEGSSLTTDVSLLAALFPPSERHMLICAEELDALDGHHSNSDSESDEDQDDGTSSEGGTLQCLQIDLRRFGLDKHGLVNRYSRVLEENGINHMYSSTFKTANLLVAKAYASRARNLLRSC